MSAMNICFVTSELVPYAKTGGLADVSGSLPIHIKEKGHDIRIMIPKYKQISERKHVIRDVIRLRDIPVELDCETYSFSAKTSFLLDSKVHIYFLDNYELFWRDSLYVDPETGNDYADNFKRFAAFSKAVLETLKTLHWVPDVIHCNDWQTSLIPVLIKFDPEYEEFFARTRTILTIHNLAYQGIFPKENKKYLNLPDELFEKDGLMEWYEKINLLKGGLLAADYLTTVSPTYANEISQSPDYGYGLESILANRKSELSGILNGADYNVWNPERDSKIAVRYNKNLIHLKPENKKMLCRYCNFEYNNEIPLIGLISRFDYQKGFDILMEALPEILQMDIQFVLLTAGPFKEVKPIKKQARENKTKFYFENKLNEQLAHYIEAGADLFLMPSRYEPCGLNQIYSLKYGTLPIVRRTGGLADTVIDVVSNPDKGTGFVFEEYSKDQMLQTIEKAVDFYSNRKEDWRHWQINGMEQDFSWERSAQEYVELYERLKED